MDTFLVILGAPAEMMPIGIEVDRTDLLSLESFRFGARSVAKKAFHHRRPARTPECAPLPATYP